MDNKYAPYTPEEFNELHSIAATITTNLPEHLMAWAWNNYKKISGDIAPQPCGCKSASGLWVKAIDTIKAFIQERI